MEAVERVSQKESQASDALKEASLTAERADAALAQDAIFKGRGAAPLESQQQGGRGAGFPDAGLQEKAAAAQADQNAKAPRDPRERFA